MRMKVLRQNTESDKSGYSLMEMALVLAVLGGLVWGMGLGYEGVKSFAREIKTTKSLKLGRDCLLARTVDNWAYPEFTKDRNCTSTDFYTVDSCLCGYEDGWGNRLYYLGGVNATSESLAGTLIADIPSSNASGNVADVSSALIDSDSRTVTEVVFILISFGEDGVADDNSYGKLFPDNNSSEVLDPADVPDFSGATDDEFVFVTRPMLLGKFQ